jgi:FemAB-related protein (PEP-CTERM system-associated)
VVGRMMHLKIQELRKKDENEWDTFVRETDDTTFFHLIGWKNVIEKTYKRKSYYLIARENGEIKGILPLFLMKSALFGNKLISVPFCDYGGVCANDEQTKTLLIEEAKKITKEKGADYLELRQLHGNCCELKTKDIYFTLILDLKQDSDFLWINFNKKVRNAIRKAIKSNLKVTMGREYINEFYDIFSKNMRDLGTPVHSINFFKNILREFPNKTNILITRYEEKAIGAMYLLQFKDTIYAPWVSSDRQCFHFNPNNMLYWEAIKYGCEKGFKYLDFGRSKWNSGTFRFKEPWGAIPKQLHYLYYLNSLDNMPNLDPSNPKYRTLTKVWKRLPVSIATKMGPKIRRHIP